MGGPRCRGVLMALALGILGVPVGLHAQEESEAADGWHFSATPWMWLLKLNGDLTVFGQESDVQVDTDLILDALEFAWMSHLELGKVNVSFFTQPIIAINNFASGVRIGKIRPTR